MAPTMRTDDDAAESAKTRSKPKGFSVGPANLPDGPYRRKVQKIKKHLIQKAKIKKEYARLKQREPDHFAGATASFPDTTTTEQEPPAQPHPDRQALMDGPPSHPNSDLPKVSNSTPGHREGRHAPSRSSATTDPARRKTDAEARLKVREEAEQERQRKIEQRERVRRTMASARADRRTGKRKLGRESRVLLERVQRLVGT